MWTRKELKTKAKGVLKGNYWKAFIVSLIIIITGGSQHNGTFTYSGNEAYQPDYQVAIIVGLFVLLAIIIRVILGYMLEVGGRKFFILTASGNEANLNSLGFCFHKERYSDVLVTMFLRSLYVFLWTLLLIIPGLIKLYAYRLVPYILADNPNIGHKRAIELSNQMTMGQKWDIFVLDLSFIGWFIFGILALGVGVLFVQPYYDLTNAELYLTLRQNAIQEGLTSAEELMIN